jgi:hypothetical protein
MEIKTENTYEATWYLLMGGKLTGIEFGKVQSSRVHKLGYTTSYKLTIANVQSQFVRYWREGRPIGNVREFSDIRIKLKRKIIDAEKQHRRENYQMP